ncbi:MAG: hypothetical protein IJZ68_08510 [Bacteroidaceae bacterium]|nr:hypothetical protein [Bacteroidaceae bacterium]
MSPDRIRFEEIVASKLPMISTSVCTGIATELITAGATLTEPATWILPKDAIKNRPYCSRCGEDSLFDGWGFPKWSVRCPNCGAIMKNAKE